MLCRAELLFHRLILQAVLPGTRLLQRLLLCRIVLRRTAELHSAVPRCQGATNAKSHQSPSPAGEAWVSGVDSAAEVESQSRVTSGEFLLADPSHSAQRGGA